MNKATEILLLHVLDQLREWNCFAEFVDFCFGPFVSEDFVRIAFVTGTCLTFSNQGEEKLVVSNVAFIKLLHCNSPGLTDISES